MTNWAKFVGPKDIVCLKLPQGHANAAAFDAACEQLGHINGGKYKVHRVVTGNTIQPFTS